ncbi:hypothetical protein G7Y89_g12419 [Cudoniella acicularis]|uniref:HTH CENPB-type domain-containing protein n=1 Tax=Cudoniella acicularis TaxID=354080 RepID=A0A8H4R946_9HELO|nr:hypothetical protein G7Y89_g12419 [Cudoniella acicularis]
MARVDKSARIDAAIAAIKSGECTNCSNAAAKYGCDRSALSKRLRGLTKSKKEANSFWHQCLTNEQEEILITRINNLTDRGMPPTSHIVKNLAEEIRGASVGKNWVGQFVRRHGIRLKSLYLRNIDNLRVSAEYAPMFILFFATKKKSKPGVRLNLAGEDMKGQVDCWSPAKVVKAREYQGKKEAEKQVEEEAKLQRKIQREANKLRKEDEAAQKQIAKEMRAANPAIKKAPQKKAVLVVSKAKKAPRWTCLSGRRDKSPDFLGGCVRCQIGKCARLGQSHRQPIRRKALLHLPSPSPSPSPQIALECNATHSLRPSRSIMSKGTTITPPASFIDLPPTPPLSSDPKQSDQVRNILKHLRLCKAGHPVAQSWTPFHLDSAGFQQLLAIIQSDQSLQTFFENKVRYDYFSNSSRFVQRMVTTIHESVRTSIVKEIERQLRDIGAGTDKAAEYARNVTYEGSPRLDFLADDDDRDGDLKTGDRHDPDAVFTHSDAKYPVAIIEVAFSQKAKELKYLADNYILGSNGNVRVLIGVSIEYEAYETRTRSKKGKQSGKATISIWRPQLVKDGDGEVLEAVQTIEEQEFRDGLGNPVAGPGIELQLKDFASKALFEDLESLTQPISISSSTLYDFISTAESRTHRVKEDGKEEKLEPGTRKRRRQRTPQEEWWTEKAQRIVEEDMERAAKRSARADRDFVYSSPSAGDG